MLNHLAPTITQPPRLHIALQRCASVSSARACPVLRESNEALYWQLVPPVKAWVSGERCIDNDAGCVPSDEHVLPSPRLPPSHPLLPPALHASASSACYHTAETCGAHARASAKGLCVPGFHFHWQPVEQNGVERSGTSADSWLRRVHRRGHHIHPLHHPLSVRSQQQSYCHTRRRRHIIQHERRAD